MNSTANEIKTLINFSPSTFYMIIGGILSICSISFFLLNNLNFIKHIKKNNEKDKNLYTEQKLLEHESYSIVNNDSKITVVEKTILFTMNFLTTFVLYGILPGLASYSTLPYGNNIMIIKLTEILINIFYLGNKIFHLSITVTVFFTPIAIFLSIWSLDVNTKRIILEFFLAIAFSSYIVIISVLSPDPPFSDSNPILGGILSLVSWILAQSIFCRVR
jgi:hypothetical protein